MWVLNHSCTYLLILIYSVPVWTAFITQHIKSEGWIHFVPSNLVLLRELQQIPFTFSYNPQLDSNGMYVLQFTTNAGKFCVPLTRWVTD